MRPGWKTQFLATGIAALLLSGCAADSNEPAQQRSTESDPFVLVRLLPQDAQSYSTVDLSALKRGLNLPSSADPYSDRKLTAFTSATLDGVYAGYPKQTVVDALDLPAATSLAVSSGAAASEHVTAVATSADPTEIREALLDLGFVDRGGILEGPDGKRAVPRIETGAAAVDPAAVDQSTDTPIAPEHGATAIRFEDGALLVSDNGELLRGLGSEANELPLRVQESLEGDATHAIDIATGPDQCILELGIATSADGSGVLVFEVEGDPDPAAFSGRNSPKFGEPEVEGDQMVIPIGLGTPEAPRDFLAIALPGYDCSR